MTTRVTVTGTGTPIATPNRAGPGVLVSHGSTQLQFDAGRSTVMRLTELGIRLGDIDALFITHQHSDHVVGLSDLLMTRWLDGSGPAQASLPVYAPSGMAADLVQHLLVPWEKEMEMRNEHRGYPARPHPELHDFEAPAQLTEVLNLNAVMVEAAQVRHEPVMGAVGYRITTPDGIVAISGDTAVCTEVEALANGAEVLVHEAFLTSALAPGEISDPVAIGAYHSEPLQIGGLAQRAGVKTLMLTHLIPPPTSQEETRAFESAVREGGFEGEVIVSEDLDSVEF